MTDMLTRFRSRPRLQWAFILVSVIVVTVHLVAITDRRTRHLGDFDVSREFGRRYVAGEPLYKGGLHYPYMPTAALSFAPCPWSIPVSASCCATSWRSAVCG
ncbi:MAG: hypothetical protein ACREIL_00270 [Nitrospiraceae bacterium]